MLPTFCPVVRIRRQDRGFTLIEMLIVVSIIAVAMTMVFGTVNARNRALSIEQAGKDLRSRIEKARDLAGVAGARIGTPRLINNCDTTPSQDLRVTIDGTNNIAIIPSAVRFDATTDQMTVECDRVDIGALTGGQGALTAPAGTATLIFSSNGRVTNPAGGMSSVAVQLQHTTESYSHGFRILASGVICQSSNPAVFGCDEVAP